MSDGIIICDKQIGMSSYDVIRVIKQQYPKGYKIGHAGTLDPFASGLLVILVGKATKLQPLFLNGDKTYTGIIKLGIITDSKDITGQIINKQDTNYKEINYDGYTNYTYDQLPPSFSAKWVNGERAYILARNNQEVNLKPSKVNIYHYTLKPLDNQEVSFKATVSKGTYIRSLNEDYFRKQGILATTLQLRRVTSGMLSLNDYPHGTRLSLLDIVNLLKLKKVVINDQNSLIKIKHANELLISETNDLYVSLINNQGQLLAIYEKNKLKNYKPTIVV